MPSTKPFLLAFLLYLGLAAICFQQSLAMTPEMLRNSMAHRVQEMNLRTTAETLNITKVSAQCNASFSALLNGNSTKILLRYADAAGKPASGIMAGALAWIGSYDECLSIPDAHYCLANLAPNMSGAAAANPFGAELKWGLCVPKGCSADDVRIGLFDIIQALGLEKTIRLAPDIATITQSDARTVHCAKPTEYTTGVIVTLTICGAVLFLCFVGSVLDILIDSCSKPKEDTIPIANGDESFGAYGFVTKDPAELLVKTMRKSIVVEFFLCFSIIRNTSRIMDTNVPPGAITSINGMRVLSMFWVILGHTFIWQLIGGLESNIALKLDILQRFTFQALINATVSVDSFFFLSGLLVAYLSFRHMEKKDGKLNLFQFYFHRFWRLTPSYMFVILFYDKMMGFLGDGPMWYLQQEPNTPCNKYWWTNLLYINNFYPTNFGLSCLDWSWYLANDMQFYVISPIILIATARFGRRGLLLTLLPLLLGSFVATAVIIGHYRLNAGLLGGGENAPQADGPNFMSYVYVKPYCRIAPYLVGMALGYLFHRHKDGPGKVPKGFYLVGWCMAFIMAVAPLYGPYSEYRKIDPKPFNRTENVFYGTFSRFSWALALAWVIFCCHTGYGGLVNKILSARFWIPLSRLTYMAYLLHPIILFAYFASFKTLMFYSDVNVSFYFLAALCVAYLCAFIVSVTIEMPMMQLEKILFKTDRKKD